MKKVHKSVFFVVLALTVAFAVISVFGISSTYGDITTTIVRGYDSLVLDRDFQDSAYVAIQSKDIPADKLALAADIVNHRMSSLGYEQFDVLTDAATGQILVALPYKTEQAANLQALVKALATKGAFEIREGNLKDENGNATGDTLNNVIVTPDMIKSVDVTAQGTNGSSPYYGVVINLTSEGKKALADATAALVEKGDKPSISYWLDNVNIGSRSLTAAVTDGKVTIYDTSSASYASAYERFVLIGSGVMPAEFKTVDTVALPNFVKGSDSLLVGLGIAVLAAMALLCVLFKMPGVCAAVAVLLQSSLIVAIQTGIFNDQPLYQLTNTSLAAHLALLAVSVVFYCFICSKVTHNITAGKLSPAKAVLNALNGVSSRSLVVFAALFAMSVVGYLVTDPTLFYGSSVYAYLGQLRPFFHTAISATLGAAFCQLLFRLMLKSLSGGSWRSASLFKSTLSGGIDGSAKSLNSFYAVVLALVLVVSLVLSFVSGTGKKADGYSLFVFSYTKEDVSSETLTPKLLELGSDIQVNYGYSKNGTSYCVTVKAPMGEKVLSPADVKTVLDGAYAETFTESLAIHNAVAKSVPTGRIILVALLCLAVFAAVVALFLNRVRFVAVLAAVVAGVATLIAFLCAMPVGSSLVAALCCSLAVSAGVCGLTAFEINAVKTLHKSADEASAHAGIVTFTGFVGALVVLLALFAGLALAGFAAASYAVAALGVAMLSATLLPTAAGHCGVSVGTVLLKKNPFGKK